MVFCKQNLQVVHVGDRIGTETTHAQIITPINKNVVKIVYFMYTPMHHNTPYSFLKFTCYTHPIIVAASGFTPYFFIYCLFYILFNEFIVRK